MPEGIVPAYIIGIEIYFFQLHKIDYPRRYRTSQFIKSNV